VLLDVACRQDLIVKVTARPGAFTTDCDTLMLCLSPSALSRSVEDELRAAVVRGDERTPDQDLDFSVRRIVEIAQRSLSPGINDPTTALYCIDRLRQAFERLGGRRRPATRRVDGQDRLRVIAEPVQFEELACNAFCAVVRYAHLDADVQQALAVALDQVIEVAGAADNPKLAALRFSVHKGVSPLPWH
jgi:uncharacterized membrane protein